MNSLLQKVHIDVSNYQTAIRIGTESTNSAIVHIDDDLFI